MNNGPERREEGVDFTAIDPVLETVSYPLTKEAFVADFGEANVERTNAGPITIGELFAGTGDDEFESPDDVRQAILALMPRESVGRQRYSDRGGSGPKEIPYEDGRADESF